MEANNNAKMREALERILSACADAEVTDCQAREIAEDEASAALAAPPRNCDRFKTKEEAAFAYTEECLFSLPLPRSWQTGEWLDWLFAEAEGGAE